MMKRHKVLIVTLCIIWTLTFSIPTSIFDPEFSSDPVEETKVADVMGESPMTETNGLSNWDFEKADSDGRPSLDWDKSAYSYTRGNMTDATQAHAGTYSASMELVPGDGSEYFSLLRTSIPSELYVRAPMILTLWMYADVVNVDVRSYVYLLFTNSSGYNFYIYYVFSFGDDWNPSNSTNSGYSYLYIDATDVPITSQWNDLSRDLYYDLYQQHTSLDTGIALGDLLITTRVNGDEKEELCRFYFDDLTISNSTDQLTEDFETNPSADWYFQNNNHDRGFLSLSDTSTQGDYSGNITASCLTNNSFSRAELYDRRFDLPTQWPVTSQIDTVLEFDWYLDMSGLSNDEDQIAELEISVYNHTTFTYYDIHYIFATGSGSHYSGNTTYDIYLKAPGFNETSTWHHTVFPIYPLLEEIGWGNMSIYDIRFIIESRNQENAWITLLVDSFDLNTYPLVNPGFDVRLNENFEINMWSQSYIANPNLNLTTDAHSAPYAANLTSEHGQYITINRYTYIPVTPTLTTDFYWRLDLLDGDSNNDASSYIEIEFDNDFSIYYYIGNVESVDDDWNSTTDLYFLADNFNDLSSTWKHLNRNVYEDSQGFVVQPSYIKYVSLSSSSNNNGKVTALWDDMHFVVDTTDPTVSRQSGPSFPNYLTSPTVTAIADDSWAGIGQVLIHYNAGLGWNSVAMTNQGTFYEGQIPAQLYATDVDYYVEAIDTEGNSDIDDNTGVYYSYTVIDDIDPVIGFDDPIWYGSASGTLLVNVSAEDPGSGLDHLELFIDGISVANFSSAPYNYTWDTRTETNGGHDLSLVARDVAGNEEETEIEVTTSNDLSGPDIASVVLTPEQPVYDQETVVTVVIVESSGLKNISLLYSIDGGSWNRLSMSQVSGTLQYTATIPQQSWGTEVTYYVEAVDDLDQSTETTEETFIVGDPYVPSISVSGPPTSVPLVGAATFEITGTDQGSGVDSIEVFVDGSSVGSSTEDAYSFEWDTATVENGEYTLRFVVTDNAGNTAYSELVYTVNNPQGFDAISSALNDVLESYGFFVGAGAVILLFIIVKLIQRRRSK